MSPRALAIALLTLTAPTLSSATIDANNNGLSDIWEQRFDASSLTQLGDEDGDGYNNFDECVAGTDPFDPTSRPLIEVIPTPQTAPEEIACLAFDTLTGKQYLVRTSRQLTAGFEPLGAPWIGDDQTREIFYSDDKLHSSKAPVRFEFWADIADTTLEALAARPNFPDQPDGILYHGIPQHPSLPPADTPPV